MTKLERMEALAEKAKQDLDQRRWERKEELWEQVRDLEARLNDQLHQEFAAEQTRLYQELTQATSAVEEERVKAAQAGNGKVKPGQRMERWACERWKDSWTKTGEAGIVEVFTKESVLPVNTPSYSRPAVGSLVLRLLKKDGTPAARVIRTDYSGTFWGWHPEGWAPEKKPAKMGP